jgi:hypothetical protein
MPFAGQIYGKSRTPTAGAYYGNSLFHFFSPFNVTAQNPT